MKKAPEPGEEVHPMLEGLQQLKFDPEENTAQELTEKYKEDGNYWMKHKKYRIAIMNYTEGILQKVDNSEMNANLYNNRSAAHFFLQNFRSSFEDAKLALKYKRDYHKVKMRILKCLMEMKKYEDACKEVEIFLSEDPTNVELINFQKQAITKKTEKLRDERKIQMQEKKKRQEFQTLVQALINRRAKFEEIKHGQLIADLTIEILKPTIAPLEEFPISMDQTGTIHYPVVFCYPEFTTCDFQQQLNEMDTIGECLEYMFSDEVEQSHGYKNFNDVNIYFENRIKGKVHRLDPQKLVKDIVSDEQFWIYNGYLTFFVVAKNSKAEDDFINQKRKPVN
jgi:tetratricopeptide (TPR) repeat protein